MGKGTEAFADLGEHCNHEECNQLDFLPFTCDGCHKVFCLEHRTYKAHSCHKSEHNNRMVVVCEVCSMSIEKKVGDQSNDILEKHQNSGDCDPSKKQKHKCPVKRCKEQLTFSNTSTCKNCSLKVCLKHRFPSDHACKPMLPPGRSSEHQFTEWAQRKGMHCSRSTKQKMPPFPSPVKAC